MRRLLDTNAYAALKRGHAGVAGIVRDSEEILVSIVVIGELLFGFRAGERYARNLADLQAFLREPRVTVSMISWATADRFGRVAAALRQKGTPIPTNDIWIASQALETGAELVTLDRHFDQVPGLALAAIEA